MNAIKNTILEFKNIQWPTISETFSKTFVVIMFSIFIGLVSFGIMSLFVPIFGGLK